MEVFDPAKFKIVMEAADTQIAADYLKPYGQYSALNVPWYSILGNHECDRGSNANPLACVAAC